VREVAAGVWHWEAPHPDWKPGEEWDERVSSYAIDDGERLLLVDQAVVAGDALIDRGNGLEIPADWVGDGLEQVRGSVRALLERPVG
jgi:hypothetical protein